MEVTISELTKSLEFTQAEVHDLKREADHLRKSNSDNQTKIQDYGKKLEDLEQRFNYQEDYSRRNNLRISGLEEPQNDETWEQTSARVSELLLNKLQLPTMNLERAHRVGPASSSRPRTVMVRFERFGDREAVLRNARKLKGTGIYINEDLCAASQAIKQSQFPLMKEARSQGKIAFFKHTKLIIKDRMGHRSASASDGSTRAVGFGTGRVPADPPGTLSASPVVVAGAACGTPSGSGATGTTGVASSADPAAAYDVPAGAEGTAGTTDGASTSAENGGGSQETDTTSRQKRDLRKGKKK